MNFTAKEMNHIFNFIVDIVCDYKEKETVVITREMCDMDLLLKMFIGFGVEFEIQPMSDAITGYWFTFRNFSKKKVTGIYTEKNNDEWNHNSIERIK